MTFKTGYKRTEESKIKQRQYWSKRREIKAKEKEIKPELTANITTSNITGSNKLDSKILTEINLNKEFKTMSEIVNPKPKKDDEKYECGSCKKKFNEKVAYCPHCGIEFDL